jgi:hypothetical protein
MRTEQDERTTSSDLVGFIGSGSSLRAAPE